MVWKKFHLVKSKNTKYIFILQKIKNRNVWFFDFLFFSKNRKIKKFCVHDTPHQRGTRLYSARLTWTWRILVPGSRACKSQANRERQERAFACLRSVYGIEHLSALMISIPPRQNLVRGWCTTKVDTFLLSSIFLISEKREETTFRFLFLIC